MLARFHILFVLTALALAGVFAYWLFVPGGVRQDLEDWERFGTPGPVPGATSTPEGSSSADTLTYESRKHGLSFRHPEGFEISEDDFGIDIRGPEFEVNVSTGCILEPERVPDLAWETEFSYPGALSALWPEMFADVFRELHRGGLSIFLADLPEEGGARGFASGACAIGENREGFLAGKCFRSTTSLEQGENYARLQNYYVNVFLVWLEFLPSFRDASACPGAGAG